MANCTHCHAEVPSNARFCPQCGEPLVKKEGCPWCQTELPSGAKFCPACQANVTEPVYLLPTRVWLEVGSGLRHGGMTDEVPPDLKAAFLSIPLNPREDRLFFATDGWRDMIRIAGFRIPGYEDAASGKFAVVGTNARLIRWDWSKGKYLSLPYAQIVKYERAGSYSPLYILHLVNGGKASFSLYTSPSIRAMALLEKKDPDLSQKRQLVGAFDQLFTAIVNRIR